MDKRWGTHAVGGEPEGRRFRRRQITGVFHLKTGYLLKTKCPPAFLLLLLLFLFCGRLDARAEDGSVYEAELAALSGSLAPLVSGSASGGAAVGRFEADGDEIRFTIEVPREGLYSLCFTAMTDSLPKYNLVFIDGKDEGGFWCESTAFAPCTMDALWLSAGQHSVSVRKDWGWFWLDCLQVSPCEVLPDTMFRVSPTLCNPFSNAEAQLLYDVLRGYYGNAILSGQYCDGGLEGNEIQTIFRATGKYPAVLGLDFMNYSPERLANIRYQPDAVEKAIAWHEKGGIVTFLWHWNAPNRSLYAGNDINGDPRWYRAYLSRNTDFNVSLALSGEDAAAAAWLDREIEELAVQIRRLQDAGVPVLWRPLHEASGTWFWWSTQGPTVYKALWSYLFHELTYHYHCNNLIWIWDGEDPDWYPGDDLVDIIGRDFYGEPRHYGANSSQFYALTELSRSPKMIALTETAVVPDPDSCVKTRAMWSWFCTWIGHLRSVDGAYDPTYTELEQLIRSYGSDCVITMDELPWAGSR